MWGQLVQGLFEASQDDKSWSDLCRGSFKPLAPCRISVPTKRTTQMILKTKTIHNPFEEKYFKSFWPARGLVQAFRMKILAVKAYSNNLFSRFLQVAKGKFQMIKYFLLGRLIISTVQLKSYTILLKTNILTAFGLQGGWYIGVQNEDFNSKSFFKQFVQPVSPSSEGQVLDDKIFFTGATDYFNHTEFKNSGFHTHYFLLQVISFNNFEKAFLKNTFQGHIE